MFDLFTNISFITFKLTHGVFVQKMFLHRKHLTEQPHKTSKQKKKMKDKLQDDKVHLFRFYMFALCVVFFSSLVPSRSSFFFSYLVYQNICCYFDLRWRKQSIKKVSTSTLPPPSDIL